MKWRTSISVHKGDELYIRGRRLTEVIETFSFTEAIFFLIKGTFPSGKETRMLDAMLCAMVEHGIAAPSTFVARTAISVGNTFNSALAAGILAIGEHHGGAIEKCAYYLSLDKSAENIVDEVLNKGEKLPGFGHKVYKNKDPRAEILFTKAKALGFSGTFVARALALEKELKRKTNKFLPINIDGAAAALILELGFDWRLGKAFFVLGRLPGLIAHAHEELIREKPYKRLEENDIEYDGPKLKT